MHSQTMMNRILIHWWLMLATFMAACHPPSPRVIMTVLGPVPAVEIGATLTHEHILVDFIGADSTGYHRWDRQDVIRKALPHLEALKAEGCRTFVECTPAWLGRDPILMKELAVRTGMNILTNTGLYGAMNNRFIPSRALEMSPGQLAGEWIGEFREGIEGTGIRPGFIKMAVDRNDSLSPMHEKLIRAAALTHLKTGLVIMSHTGTDKPAFDQIAILQEMNVSPEAFIWTHAQAGTLEGWEKAARMGAWIALDGVREDRIQDYVEHLSALKSAGLLDHVLISHDSGWYRVGQDGGGTYHGYTTIFSTLIPALLRNGFSREDIRLLLQENPARAFGLRIRAI
jgi:phosphotriesterase-related protein